MLAQLSNRIQHGLRAYTPAEQKAVRAAAAAFRENPAFDSAEALLELGTGEALVSLLNEDGQPSIVERAQACCRRSACMAAADADDVMEADRRGCQAHLVEKYGEAIDRESAYEKLAAEKSRRC